MQTAVAGETLIRIGVASLTAIRIGHFASFPREAVVDVREGNQTGCQTYLATQAKLQGDVVQTGVLGIHLQVATGKISILQANACIKQKGDGVNRRIGSRIAHIDEFVSQTVGDTAHASVGRGALIGQLTESISGIGRVDPVLSQGNSCYHHE